MSRLVIFISVHFFFDIIHHDFFDLSLALAPWNPVLVLVVANFLFKLWRKHLDDKHPRKIWRARPLISRGARRAAKGAGRWQRGGGVETIRKEDGFEVVEDGLHEEILSRMREGNFQLLTISMIMDLL